MKFILKIIIIIFCLNIFTSMLFSAENKELNLEKISDDIRYKNAYQFFKLERYDKALQLFGEYLEIYTNGIHRKEAYNNIAHIYFMRYNYKLALKYYQLLYEEFSETEEGLMAYYYTGVSYSQMGKAELAKQIFKRIVDEYPASYAAHTAKTQLDLEDILNVTN